MRADAVRNRDLIIAAAIVEMSRHGDGVAMAQIAATAGVSVGALYRHFPDRESLIEHIAIDSLTKLIEAGDDALRRDDPFTALREVMSMFTTLPLGLTHSLSESTIRSSRLHDLIAESDRRLLDLIARAQAGGGLRSDYSGPEVLAAISTAVCRPGAHPSDPVVAIVFDGLRAH